MPFVWHVSARRQCLVFVPHSHRRRWAIMWRVNVYDKESPVLRSVPPGFTYTHKGMILTYICSNILYADDAVHSKRMGYEFIAECVYENICIRCVSCDTRDTSHSEYDTHMTWSGLCRRCRRLTVDKLLQRTQSPPPSKNSMCIMCVRTVLSCWCRGYLWDSMFQPTTTDLLKMYILICCSTERTLYVVRLLHNVLTLFLRQCFVWISYLRPQRHGLNSY